MAQNFPLNSEQRNAVTAPDGPALVLAGAGSGKTRVIVERIVWLIEERGVDPRNILAVTFTNRAAGEMRDRTAHRLGVERIAAWMGTFHAFGLYVLRREMEKLGRPKTFTIFDDSDQLSLIKRLIKDLPGRFPEPNPREALWWIADYKQRLETPTAETIDEEDQYAESCIELWKRYQDVLQRASAIDFDDLLALSARLFTEYEDVRDRYRSRYRHILIDEYQDTNHAQYVLARALAGENGNLFVVGDEDQSIYSWRGADIQNILRFADDFPGANVYRLEQNYRSTAPILSAANAVVANNRNRLGKNLWTDKQGGEKLAFFEAKDAEEEANFVVDRIAKTGEPGSGFAVLYRTNGQSRVLEEAFRRRGLPYIVIGGMKFYARKEVKDLLSYLRLAINQNDDESLRRVINVPPRQIGGVTLARIEALADKRRMPLFETLRTTEEDASFTTRVLESVVGFVSLIDDLALKAADAKVEDLVEHLLERTGYRGYVEKSDEKDFRTRLEVVDEFVAACAEFDKRARRTLADFLHELALVSDTDELAGGAPAVSMLTCHSAKGLEFDHVFLVGMEEGFLPHHSAAEDDEDLEEERRLCYVAMTRARKSLTLTAARERSVYGRGDVRERSRFLREIPADHLQIIKAENPNRAAVHKPEPPRTDAAKLKTGVRVRHAHFGTGTVMYTSGSDAKQTVQIRFDAGRIRKFVVNKAPIEVLEGKTR